MKDWRWWRFRFVIIPNGDTWTVWDSVSLKPVFEDLPLLEAYRTAVDMNLEIAHERQPA